MAYPALGAPAVGAPAPAVAAPLADKPTTTVVVASPNPSTAGATVTLTATVEETGATIRNRLKGTVLFELPAGQRIAASLDNDGVAIITTTQLITGTVFADYSGDKNDEPSEGSVFVVVTAAPIATTTALVASPNPANVGQQVTLQATVTSGQGTPLGSVTFSGPGGFVQTVTVGPGGVASVTTTAVASGTMTATFHGIGRFQNSSGTTPLTVNARPTTTTVSAVPNPSTREQTVTATATVTAVGGGTPTGTVTFTASGGGTMTAPLIGGQAVVNSSTLSTGTLTATYNGSGDFAGSTGTVGITVNPAPTTVAMTAVPDPSRSGQTVVITAVVDSDASGVPTGSINFSGPGVSVTVPLGSDGAAEVTTTTLGTGTVTANYSGDALFASGVGTIGVTVDPAATRTTLVLTPDPATTGGSVTATATVVSLPPGSGIPTGSVHFTSPSGLDTTVALDASGVASATFTATVSEIISADYSGAVSFSASSDTASLDVDKTPTVTTLNANPAASVIGDPVTLTASVVANPSSAGTPTGSVTFSGPGGFSQVVPLDAGGNASVTTSELSTGEVTAKYSGDPLFAGSSDTVSVTVDLIAASVAVTAQPNPGIVGVSTTLTATVTSADPTRPPTGTIRFRGPRGLNILVPIDGAGQASISTRLAPGTVFAAYSGDPVHDVAQGQVVVTLGQANTTTAVVVSPSTSLVGQVVTLTATVAPVTTGLAVPTGFVTFTAPGGVSIDAALNGSGIATAAIPATASGTVTATYSGNPSYTPSSGSAAMSVGMIPTTTILTAVPDPSGNGDTVTLAATVTSTPPGAGPPAGSLTFVVPHLPPQTVPLVNGVATLVTNHLVTSTITATYLGSAQFASSTTSLNVTVNQPVATETVVTPNPNPSQPGQTVTLTARVETQDDPGNIPSGSVTFSGPGGFAATVPLDASGIAVITTSALVTGTVSAAYSGSTTHASSIGSASVTVEVLGAVTIQVLVDGADIVVGFTSPTPQLNLLVPVSGGTGKAGPIKLTSGTYEITANDLSGAGYGFSSVACSDDNSTGDAVSRTATIELAAAENLTCTFAIANSRERTIALIQEFMDNRARLILDNQPDVRRRIDRLNGGGSVGDPISALMNYLPGVIEGHALTVSASLGAIDRLAGAQKQNPLDVWFEGTFSQFETDDAAGQFGLASFGADYLISNDLLVGGFMQLDQTTQSPTTGLPGTIGGTGVIVGPYATIRLVDNIYLDLLGGFGRSWNSVSPFDTYTDAFGATRWMLSATLEGDWQIDRLTLSPQMRMSSFSETSDAYVDGLGVPIPSITASLGEAAIGSGISYRLGDTGDIIIVPRLDFEILADLIDMNLTDTRGRVEIGIDTYFPGGMRLGVSVSRDGIGSGGLQATGARLEMSAAIN